MLNNAHSTTVSTMALDKKKPKTKKPIVLYLVYYVQF